MKIALVDVDGRNFPNLALMKLAAWIDEQTGRKVELLQKMQQLNN